MPRDPRESLPLAARFARPAQGSPVQRSLASKARQVLDQVPRGVVQEDPLTRLARAGQGIGLERYTPSATDYKQSERPLQGAALNNRGNSVIISPGGINPLVVSTPQAVGDDAEIITATLGIAFANNDPELNVALPITVKALLNWGIGNANFTAECDWIRGTNISLQASFLRIGARFDQTGDAMGPDVKLDAGLSYGQAMRSSASPARNTVFVTDSSSGTPSFTIGAGVISDPIVIPSFAISFGVQSLDVSSGTANPTVADVAVPIKVVQRGGGSTSVVPPGSAYDYVTGGNTGRQDEGQVPIQNGSNVIFVQNNSGGPALISIVFTMAF